MGTFIIYQERAATNIYLIPNANGCNTELISIGETNNWECIDDPIAVPDADATFVYNVSAGTKYDLYNLPNHTTESGVINYVQIYARAKSHETAQHADGIYKIIETDDNCSNIYKSDDIDLVTGYTTYDYILPVNPRTLVAWTWNNIDDLQAGLECNSPEFTGIPKTLTIRPTANGTGQPEGAFAGCTGCCGAGLSWTCVDEEISDCAGTALFTPAFPANVSACEVFELQNHTTETGPITSISVFISVRGSLVSTGDFAIRLYINGTAYDSSSEAIGNYNCSLISETWTQNPDTSAAWTWSDIDDLEAGCLATGGDEKLFSQIYVVVNYTEIEASPQIRTTQCYVKVNYTPPDIECTLNKPEQISVDHSRNVKMLNFWSGNREVYDLNRSGKTMVLTGSEYQTDTCDSDCPCERIECVRQMGKDGSTISISGLSFDLFNGIYKIRSFGWKKISDKPKHYEWILELEDNSG